MKTSLDQLGKYESNLLIKVPTSKLTSVVTNKLKIDQDIKTVLSTKIEKEKKAIQ